MKLLRIVVQFAIIAAVVLTLEDRSLAQMQVSGSRVWTTVTNAAGTVFAAVLDLTNNDAMAVAIVDANGTQVTSFGGGTQYAEDTAGADADVLTLAGARRQDSLTTDTSTDGDRAPLKVNNVGAMWVTINGTPAVTQSGAWSVGQSGTWNVGLSAGSNLIGKVAQATTCGATPFDQVWAAVPTSATSVTGTTTCDLIVIVSNTNSTAQSILITDGQGSPITIVPTFSIPGNSIVRFELGKSTTGFKWTAGGAGLTGSASGVQ